MPLLKSPLTQTPFLQALVLLSAGSELSTTQYVSLALSCVSRRSLRHVAGWRTLT